MGNRCYRGDIYTEKISRKKIALQKDSKKPPSIKGDLAQAKMQLKLNKISQYVKQILDGSSTGLVGVAYTQNQANDLAKALIDGLIEL